LALPAPFRRTTGRNPQPLPGRPMPPPLSFSCSYPHVLSRMPHAFCGAVRESATGRRFPTITGSKKFRNNSLFELFAAPAFALAALQTLLSVLIPDQVTGEPASLSSTT